LASDDWYQSVATRNLALLRELEELDRARRVVKKQLGLSDSSDALRDALVIQWLVRLYAYKVGEGRILREVRELIGDRK